MAVISFGMKYIDEQTMNKYAENGIGEIAALFSEFAIYVYLFILICISLSLSLSPFKVNKLFET